MLACLKADSLVLHNFDSLAPYLSRHPVVRGVCLYETEFLGLLHLASCRIVQVEDWYCLALGDMFDQEAMKVQALGKKVSEQVEINKPQRQKFSYSPESNCHAAKD